MSALSHILKYPNPPRPRRAGIAIVYVRLLSSGVPEAVTLLTLWPIGADLLNVTSNPEIWRKLEFGIGKTDSDRSNACFSWVPVNLTTTISSDENSKRAARLSFWMLAFRRPA